MGKYELVDYFDVTGNQVTGWTVNNTSNQGIITIIGNSDEDFVKALVDYEFFKSNVTLETMNVTNNGSKVEFYSKDDKRPLCRLDLKGEL